MTVDPVQATKVGVATLVKDRIVLNWALIVF